MSSDVVIVGAKRTAIGSFQGQFSGVATPTLGAQRFVLRWPNPDLPPSGSTKC